MVENFGSYLKHERELRGVPLEEIAESTKIHIRFLEALENNEFDLLPGEVFIKGYIRSYAQVIGIDVAEMVNTYDESAGRDRKEEIKKVQETKQMVRSRKKKQVGYALAGVILTGVFFLGYWGVISNNKKGHNGLSHILPGNDSPVISKASDDATGLNPQDVKKSEEESHAQKIQPETLTKKESPSPEVLKKPESAPQENNLPGPSLSNPPSIPQKLEPERTKLIAQGPPSESNPPVSPIDILKGMETPDKPLESKKKSDIPEKDVIIQYVAENSEPGSSISSLSESDSKPLHLKIQVQGNSWFNVTVDGAGKEDFILPGGSIKNIYGSERFRLTIGNRQGTHLFLNGKSIDLPPGSNDVIRDFNITANLIE